MKCSINKNGHVYVIEFENEVKIGRSLTPQRRIRCISTSKGEIPKRIYITEKCSNYEKLETDTHKKFKNDRTVGEYFKVEFDQVVLFLKSAELIQFSEKEIEKSIEKHLSKIESFVIEMSEKETKRLLNQMEVHCFKCNIPISIWEDSNHSSNCKITDECCIYEEYYSIQEQLEDFQIDISKFKHDVYEMLEKFDIKNFEKMYNELVYSSFDLGIISENIYKKLLE